MFTDIYSMIHLLRTFHDYSHSDKRQKLSSDNIYLMDISLSLVIYSMFCVSLAIIILAYLGNTTGVLLDDPLALAQLPLYKAFTSPQLFYFGIVAQITTSITAMLDILLDYASHRKARANDVEITESPDCWSERLFFITINVWTGITFLCLREETNAPYIYTCVYCIQCVAGFGGVLLICNKLEPVYFTRRNIVTAYLTVCGTDVAEVIGVGHSIFYWSNIVSFVTAGLFFWFVLGKIMVPWLRSLSSRNMHEKPLTINEISCLWYSLSTLALKFFIPGAFALPKLMQWSQCDSLQVHAFVYSLVLLGAIICNVPARLAQAAVNIERCILVDMKRGIIRYLSHEVRSPLNIISSAINFMELDLAAVAPCTAKTSVEDTLSAMRQATQDILHTMNEMLQMETINSGSLSMDLQMVPCADVMEIVQRNGVVAREKGVEFSVHDELSSRDQNVLSREDIEEGSITELPRLKDMALYVDKFKIGQVVRNLVTNAVKFTPVGHSVAVNIRHATTAEEEAIILEDILKANRDKKRQTSRQAVVEDSDGRSDYRITSHHAVIEVVDTGAGIAPDDHSKVFRAFAQFRANELQGGGGTGLGLWISQEIVKKHGSMIHFRSEGLGKGTTFYFMLPMYAHQRQTSNYGSQGLNSSNSKYFFSEPRILPDDGLNEILLMHSTQAALKSSFDAGSGTYDSVNVERKVDLKVLVVDDSKANLKFLVRHLKQAAMQTFKLQLQQSLHVTVGLELVEEMDGTTAVATVIAAAAVGSPFHMVFMDDIMKVMHGPEAARCMRQKGFAGLIVGVTGNVMQKDVEEYIRAGADHIMPKPITTADVAGMIERMVTRVVNEEDLK